MTYEEYKALRDKGQSDEEVRRNYSQSQQQKSNSSGQIKTYEDYKKLRDQGYSDKDITSGAYKNPRQPASAGLWGKTVDEYQKWIGSQGSDYSSWDPTTASKYSRQFSRYAQDAESYLKELERAGRKAGDTDYDEAKGIYDYFSGQASALTNNTRAQKQYQQQFMYADANGSYLSYDQAKQREKDLQDRLAGMKDEWVSDYSTFGGHRESNYTPEEKKEAEQELAGLQEWLSGQDADRDYMDWYQRNLAGGQNSEYAFNAAGRRLSVTENNVEYLKKQQPQRELYATDEWGNLDAAAEAKYNADYKAWNDKYTQAIREQQRAQKDYSYAEQNQFNTAAAVAASGSVKDIIALGKQIAEGQAAQDSQEYDSIMGLTMPSDVAYVYMMQSEAKGRNKIQDTEGWSEEKKNTYYYLLGSGKDASAERLARMTNDAWQKAQMYQEIYQPIEQFQKENPGWGGAAATAAGVVIPLTMGLPEYLGMAEEYLATGDINMNRPRLTQISQQMVGTTAEQLNNASGTINESIPILGGKGLGDAYQLGISILQSQLSMYTSMGMEGVTLAQFFGSAASSGIMDSLEKGMDPGKALALGTMQGAAEAIGEVVSIDKMIQIKDSATARSMLRDVFSQMGVEGSEEAFTTMMNTLADMIVNGDKNELQLAMNSYLSQGMDYDEAQKLAEKDWLNGLAFDFVGGAISGGVGAGMATARANTGTYRGNVSYLTDLTSQTAEGSRSREMAAGIPENGRISAFRGNQLAAQVQQDLISNNTANAVQAIEQRLTELGETGDVNRKARDIANAIIQDISGDEAGGFSMRASDQISANATANMRTVMQELQQARETGVDYGRQNEAWTDSIMKGRFLDDSILQGGREGIIPTLEYSAGRAQEKALNDRVTQMADLEQQIREGKKELGRLAPTDQAGRRAVNERIQEAETKLRDLQEQGLQDEYSSYTAEEKAASVNIDGKQMTVTGLTNENGTVQVKLSGEDGASATVEIDDARLPKALRSLALKAKALDWAAAAAFRYYKPGTDINDYIRRIQIIRGFASETISRDAFMKTKTVQALNNAPLAEFLYGEGQRLAEARSAKANETARKLEKLQEAAAEKTGTGTVRTKGKGNVDITSGADIEGQHFEGIQGKKLSKTQNAVVKMVNSLANTLNIDYVIFDGETGGVQGMYRDGVVYLNINAGRNVNGTFRSLAAETLSHELTHFIEQFAPKEYEDLRAFVVETIMNGDEQMFERRVRQKLGGLDPASAGDRYDGAVREVVADACTTMLQNSEAVTQLARQNLTLAQKIQDFITETVALIKEAFAESGDDTYRVERKAMENELDRLQQLWDEGIFAASTNYNTLQTLKDATSIGDINIKDLMDALGTDGESLFQVAAFEHDEPEYRAMLKTSGLSETDIDNLFDTIDSAMEIIKGNLEALDYAWEADIDDRGFSPVKPNSDKLYKVSQDFSTLCRKRILQGAIANQLQASLNRALTREEGIAIRDALMAIQAEGKQIEVACALCYVEAARMKSPAQIQKFLDDKEKVLKDFFAGQDRATMKQRERQAELDVRRQIREELGDIKGKDGKDINILDPKDSPLKRLPTKIAQRIRDAKRAVRASYTVTAEQQRIIADAMKMTAYDFTDPVGLENLAKNHREIFDAYTSFVRNATKSKGIENDTWWRAGDSAKISDLLIQQMNNENGLRSQSWSDFQVIHLMDYIAATIELSARGAKQHAYTKVPDYVDLMGDTGVMINMSLIPTREYSGKLEYDNVEGFVAKEAKRLREKYHKTAGTICIGIHNDQIRQLLADAFIDYVIPYHNSGMAAHTRVAMHIPTWENYQDFQGEKKLSRSAAAENAKRFGVMLLDESDPMWQVSPNFSDWFNLDRARQIAKNTGKTGKYGVMTGGYAAMQDAARAYMQLCAERGLAPKFSYGKADFSGEENYWKLLIDRKMVDNVTGDIIEQEKIQPKFDFNTIERILNDELDRYGRVKADQNEATRRVTEAFLSGKLKAGMRSEAIAEIMQKPVDNISITNITQSTGGRAGQFQRADDVDTLFEQYRSLTQQANDYQRQRLEMERSDEYGELFDRVNQAKGREESKAALEAMKEWSSRTGYDDIAAKEKQARADANAANKAYYSALEQRDIEQEQKDIEKSGLSPEEYFRKKAVKEFGYTPYFYDAGYILPNGKMLNFSGEKGKHYGVRGQDHRGISTIYASSESGSAAMNRFMQDGNIRIMAESPGVDLATAIEPTAEQYAVIRKFVREFGMKNDYFNVDLTDASGRTVGNYEYDGNISPTKVIADIQYYFANGQTRDNTVSQFHGQYQRADGETENAIYIPDGHSENGDPVSFIDEILDGRKKGETRTHKSLTRKWVGIAKNGLVYGRVRLGDPILITNTSPEYQDAMISGTEYDLKDGESKYYFPILEKEDFRDNPRQIIRNGNYGLYQFQRADNLIEDTEFEIRTRDDRINELMAENKVLEEAVTKLKQEAKKLGKEMKLSRGPQETRLSDARKLAGEILKETGSSQDAKAIANRIKAVGDAIYEDADYVSLRGLAVDIARDIVSDASVALDEGTGTEDLRNDFKTAMKGRTIYVPEQYRSDTGDWNNFRKRYFGIFKFSNSGTPVDQVYKELLQEMPGVLDASITNPGDMLNEMADKWDALQPVMGNPFEEFWDEAIESYTNRILQAALDGTLRTMAPTYADRMNARLDKERAAKWEKVEQIRTQMNSRLEQLRTEKNERIEEIRQQGIARKQEALARERAAKWEKVAKTRKYYQDMAERASVRRKNTATRGQIRSLISALNTRLMNPTEKRYVPAPLVNDTIEILQMIDLSTERTGEKLQAKLAMLQQKYTALKNDETFTGYAYDPVMDEMIQNMAKAVGDTPLNKMSMAQLGTVLDTLKSLEHIIRTAVTMKVNGEERNAYEIAKGMVKETRSAKGTAKNAFSQLYNKYITNTMRPDVVFEYFSGFTKNSQWSQVADMLNEAQRKGQDLQMEFAQIFDEVLQDKKALQKLTSAKVKDMVDVGLKDENGETVLITRDFMLALYLNLMNEDNARHIMRGGMQIPDFKEYLAGKGDRGYSTGSARIFGISERLSEIDHAIAQTTDEEELEGLKQQRADVIREGEAFIDDLRFEIRQKLTEYDMKWIKAWRDFNAASTKALNDTTMEVYGIKKATVENYFPIVTDKNFVNAPMENIVHDISLENVGFMKERVHGSNPIKLMGLSDIVNMQANRTAQYAAIMPATRAFGKIYNKTMPGYSTSVQDSLFKQFRGDGKKFIENLMADLQGGRKADFTIFDRLRGRMAQATLSLNPRVALAQTASFPTAAAELGWKPVLKALAKGGKNGWVFSAADRDLIAKYSSALWFRSRGYTSVEMGDVKNMNQLQHKVMDKVGWAMNWINFMDTATVGRLWYAAQYYVDEHNPSLKKGTDAYYEAVAEAFNRTVERTQPNYTTMQRPELLRSPNALYRQLAMFMTQRLQNQSIMYGAAAKYLKYRSDLKTGKNGITEADVKAAGIDAARAASSQIAAAVTITVFKFLSDALLHRLKAYRKKEDQTLDAESISLAMLNNFAESIVSNMFLGSELYSAVKSIVTKETYYGIELSGVSTLTETLENIVKFGQKPSWKMAKKLGESLAQYLGIPAANAEKLGLAVWYHMQDAMNGEFLSFESDAERSNAQNAKLLTEAYMTGNTENAEKYAATFKDEDTMMDALRTYVRSGYVVKEGTAQTISKEQAVQILIDAGMRKKDAEEKVQEWTCELVTGIPFSKIKDEYMAGNITQARVSQLLQTYGLRDKESADRTARGYACEKATGHPYADLKEAYLNDEISKTDLEAALRTYGLMKQSEAHKKTVYYDFLKENPEADISEERAYAYMTTVKPTGISASEFTSMLYDVDADTNGSFSQDEVGKYLNAKHYTTSQNDALWETFGNKWKISYDTWQVKTAADAAGTGKGAGNGNVSQDELGYYLVEQIRSGRMTQSQADKYWSSLLTTSKKDFSAWCRAKRIGLG